MTYDGWYAIKTKTNQTNQYTHIYIYIYIYLHQFINMLVHVYAFESVCMCFRALFWACLYVCVNMYTYIHVCVCVCVHAYCNRECPNLNTWFYQSQEVPLIIYYLEAQHERTASISVYFLNFSFIYYFVFVFITWPDSILFKDRLMARPTFPTLISKCFPGVTRRISTLQNDAFV